MMRTGTESGGRSAAARSAVLRFAVSCAVAMYLLPGAGAAAAPASPDPGRPPGIDALAVEAVPGATGRTQPIEGAREVTDPLAEATADLVGSPGSLRGCDDDADACIAVRPVDTSPTGPVPLFRDTGDAHGAGGAGGATPGRTGQLADAETLAFTTEASPFPSQLDSWAPLCVGTGTDGSRVRPVFAYDGNLGPLPPEYLEDWAVAIANADLTFSQSAALTGGSRRVRYTTTNGSPGCSVSVVTVPVTTGLASFEDLLDELYAVGVLEPTGDAPIKYLIWSEGALIPESPGACGVGLTYIDDSPGRFDNANALQSYAAVDQRCWDINGGGSVPAHELMHTLGAVQASAPHYNGTGHCTDDHDNMCYAPDGGAYPPVAGCTDAAFGEARFDCNSDDYFHTAPAVGSYLCRFWNTARSPYLQGWDTGYGAPPGPVTGLSVSVGPNRVTASWTPPATCPGPSRYQVDVLGAPSVVLGPGRTSVTVNVAAGARTVTVRPWRDGAVGPAATKQVTVPAPPPPAPPPPNRPPYGGIALSVVDGRNYGLLAWAIDPETKAPTRMRVWVEGVSLTEHVPNYNWADMPRVAGVRRTESLLYLAQVPPGDRQVCVYGLDPQGLGWVTVGCTRISVK